MRTYSARITLFGSALAGALTLAMGVTPLTPALSFDGNGPAAPVSANAALGLAPVNSGPVDAPSLGSVLSGGQIGEALRRSLERLSPMEAFRSGTAALKTDKAKAVASLEYAAEKGHVIAQWKLARMYAEGDGVTQDDVRAFEYFRRIADGHAEDSPGTQQSRFVASAFVALGHYYLEGIPGSTLTADPARARRMFSYAASYFGDPDAQFQLARLYMDGDSSKDSRQALRWLSLSANKGQYQAQARLGAMLFDGEDVPRQAARGLMWLTLAKDAAPVSDEAWVNKLYDRAVAKATEEERTTALAYLERYLKGRRD